ncbi:hypothetical protein L209DRAFT_214326 [Thermothelomyces heterothallicus CBS 203.75]
MNPSAISVVMPTWPAMWHVVIDVARGLACLLHGGYSSSDLAIAYLDGRVWWANEEVGIGPFPRLPRRQPGVTLGWRASSIDNPLTQSFVPLIPAPIQIDSMRELTSNRPARIPRSWRANHHDRWIMAFPSFRKKIATSRSDALSLNLGFT